MKKITLIIAIICTFFICEAQINDNATWDYPVKPGMPEWKEFQLTTEMVKAYQIPEDVLSSLSTNDLTETCLQYPLFINVYAFNSLSDGIENLNSEFNGIRELYSRKDAAIGLIKHYNEKVQSFSFLDKANSEAAKGIFMISVTNLEILLSQIVQHDYESRKEILKCLVNGYEEKLNYKNYFGYGFLTNCFSRAKVIEKMDKAFINKLPGKELNPVISSGIVDDKTFNIINELSYELIK